LNRFIPVFSALACISIILSVCSLIAHIFGWSGFDLHNRFPHIMLMHAGMFACFVPAVLLLTRYRMLHRRASSLKNVLQVIPAPFLIVQILLLLWYLFCFFYSSRQNAGAAPVIIDGQYVLSNHGTIIREITVEAYRYHSSRVLVMFSALWMCVYWGAATIILSVIRLTKQREVAHVQS
jgi:hypothetical protein